MPRVDQQALELVLEDRPHRLPVHAGGLHRHVRDAMRRQPVAQRQQPLHRGLELGHVLQPPAAAIGHTDRGGDLRLVHVNTGHTLKDPIEHLLHLPALPSVAINGSPPGEPHKQPTSLMGVLKGTVRGAGETPTPNQSRARWHQGETASTGGASILPDFTRPRVATPAMTTNRAKRLHGRRPTVADRVCLPRQGVVTAE